MEREEATTTSSRDERGAGGKIRKPSVPKPPLTPYSRPSSSTQTQQTQDNGGGGGWLQSASRLISGGATKFFPSLFSKPRPSDAEQPGEVMQDASDEVFEEFHDIQMTRPMEGGPIPLEVEVSKCGSYIDVHTGNTLHRPSDGTGISEIEQMLKGKTLSRDDLHRLTEILQSRIAVQPDVDECGKRNSDVTTGAEAVVASLSQENKKRLDDEKEAVYINRVIGESSNPFPQSISRDIVGGSPVDLAKAYMGTRTSEFGVGSQSVALTGETPIPASRFLSNSAFLSPTLKSSAYWPGAMVQQSHSYLTPQTERGRVGFHTSRRTPYSRGVHLRSTSKLEGGGDRSRNIFSPNVKQLQTPVYGGSQVTRKSISSHIDGFGSVGPMRRTHRKFHGTTTPSKGTCSSRTSTSGPVWDRCFDASNNLLPMVTQNIEPGPSTSSNTKFQPVDMKAPSSVGLSTFHSHSNDMARKILEHLDRTVPTPEKKSAELKLATSWRKHPSSESTTSIVKAPFSNPHVESFKSQQSSHLLGQKFFDQEKEVRGTSLLNDQPKQRKPDEATNIVNTKTLGSSVLSSEISSGQSAVQFNSKITTELKKTPEFEVNKNEVSTRPDSQSGKNHQLPRQSEIGGQAFSKFARTDAGYEVLSVPKKHSAHTFGNKPSLASISVTKPDPKCRVSSDNGSDFAFPVSASSGSLFEPPTPSIMPSSSATALPQPKENRTVPSNNCSLKEGDPSYSFGSKISGGALVFSFPSSSSAPSDFSTPKFNFGSGKARISTRSVGEDAVCW